MKTQKRGKTPQIKKSYNLEGQKNLTQETEKPIDKIMFTPKQSHLQKLSQQNYDQIDQNSFTRSPLYNQMEIREKSSVSTKFSGKLPQQLKIKKSSIASGQKSKNYSTNFYQDFMQKDFTDNVEKSATRDNWNYFVGDSEYKTNFFLKFLSPLTQQQYQRHLVQSSSYNIIFNFYAMTALKLILLFMKSQLNSKSFLVTMLALAISLFSISKKFQKTTQSLFYQQQLQYFLVNCVTLNLSLSFIQIYEKVKEFDLNHQQIIQKNVLLYESIQKTDAFLSENELIYKQVLGDILKYIKESNFHQILDILLHVIQMFILWAFQSLNIHTISDWMDYICVVVIFYLSFYFQFQSKFIYYDFLFKSSINLVVFLWPFTLNEKMRKELFILNLTNSKTKKQLMRIFNQIQPSCIIQKDGGIQICNQSFVQIFQKYFNIKVVPNNFLKFVKNDIQVLEQLNTSFKQLFNKGNIQGAQVKFDNGNQIFNESIEIEIIIKKENQGQIDNKYFELKQNQSIPSQSQQQHVSNQTQKNIQIQENAFQNQVAFKIILSLVQFKYKKCIMMMFHPINDQKTINRLFSKHISIISQKILDNQNDMENLHKQIQSKQMNIQQYIGQYIGNSQLLMNNIQLLLYYFNNISNHSEQKIQKYFLKEEIDYCLDGLTESLWKKDIEFERIITGILPEKVVGDLQKLRLCLTTLFKFGIDYSGSKFIQVNCEVKQFKEVSPQKKLFDIYFTLTMQSNRQFEIEPIRQIFTEIQMFENEFQNQNNQNNFDFSAFESKFQKMISQKYQIYHEHVQYFGLGMIFLPIIVKQLMGECFFSYQSIDKQNGLPENEQNELKQIKLGFNIPFEPALGSDNQQIQKSYQIKKLIQERGGKKIFKTQGLIKRISVSETDNLINKNNRLSSQSTNHNIIQLNTNNIQNLTNKNFSSNNSLMQQEKFQKTHQICKNYESLRNNNLNQINIIKEFVQENSYKNQQSEKSIKNILETTLVLNSQDHLASDIENEQIDKPSQKNSILQIFEQVKEKQSFNIKSPNLIELNNSKEQRLRSPLIQSASKQNLSVFKNEVHSEYIFKKKSNDTVNHSIKSSKKNQKYAGNFSFMEGVYSKKKQVDNYLELKIMDMNQFQGPIVPESSNIDIPVQELFQVDLKNKENNFMTNYNSRLPTYDLNLFNEDKLSETNFQSKRNGGELKDLYNQAQKNIDNKMKENQFNLNKLNSIIQSQQNQTLMSDLPLSSLVQRQIFNRFQKISCASKNMFKKNDLRSQNLHDFEFNSSEKQNLDLGDIKVNFFGNLNEEIQKIQQIPQGRHKSETVKIRHINSKSLDQQIDNNDFIYIPKIKKKNQKVSVFMVQQQIQDKGLQFLKKKNKNLKLSLKSSKICEQYIQNINQKLNEKQKQKNKISGKEGLCQKHKSILWLKNIVMYPPYQNQEYDAQDKNFQLKNLKETLKELDLWNKLHFQNIKQQQKNAAQNTGISKLEIFSNSNLIKEKNPSIEKRQNSVETLSPVQLSKNDIQQKQIMLIIEDNMFCQQYLLEILNILGVEYETAINGQDGVKIVERYLQRGKMFDIILMDLIMPTMDGYQASSEIRELEKKYNVNSNDRLFICGYINEKSKSIIILNLKSQN